MAVPAEGPTSYQPDGPLIHLSHCIWWRGGNPHRKLRINNKCVHQMKPADRIDRPKPILRLLHRWRVSGGLVHPAASLGALQHIRLCPSTFIRYERRRSPSPACSIRWSLTASGRSIDKAFECDMFIVFIDKIHTYLFARILVLTIYHGKK